MRARSNPWQSSNLQAESRGAARLDRRREALRRSPSRALLREAVEHARRRRISRVGPDAVDAWVDMTTLHRSSLARPARAKRPTPPRWRASRRAPRRKPAGRRGRCRGDSRSPGEGDVRDGPIAHREGGAAFLERPAKHVLAESRSARFEHKEQAPDRELERLGRFLRGEGRVRQMRLDIAIRLLEPRDADSTPCALWRLRRRRPPGAGRNCPRTRPRRAPREHRTCPASVSR